MPFEQVLGQDYAVKILKSALASGRLASSYLFFGPEGCGKKITASALAQALYCPRGGCGQCAVCKRIQEGKHPDVLLFTPATSTFKIDQVRLVLHEASLRPYEAAGRLFILDKAELFNEASGNALLKLLEEPLPGHVFVLVSTQPAKVLPTIRSRCQPVRFSPLGEKVLVQVLSRGGHAADVALEAGRLAGGSLKRAAELLQGDGKERLEEANAFLAAVSAPSLLPKLDWAASAASDKQALERVLSLVGVLLRELWVRRLELPASLHLLSQAPTHGRGLSGERLEHLLKGLARAQDALRKNANPALVLENLVLAGEA